MGMSEAKSLAIESWILYTIALLVVICRTLSRRILLGSLKKLQIDDYIMYFVFCCYTIVIVGINQTAVNLNAYLPPAFLATITPAEILNAIYGCKWTFATEMTKLATVWGCKACLLILYNHMTKGLPRYHRAVKYVAAYTVLGYIIVMILFLGVWCRPVNWYWKVPVPNSQCASYYNHLIDDAVFNITSDLLILSLPIPLLIKAQLPLKRKIVLFCIFSLGILVILCAVLNRYYNFTAGYGSLIYLNWYAGETSTAVIVANIPHLWPLISRVFGLGAFKSSSGPDSNRYHLSSSNQGIASRRRTTHHGLDHDGYVRSESEERIAGGGNGGWGTKSMGEGDVELAHANGGFDTGVMGGRREEAPAWGMPIQGSGMDDKDHIMKTVHINQFSEND
ncbi:MAG: hypothetical protein ASARMPRED_003102 [Alectoria sarmentosa]|nr:MAG: hypothetical protein ASARMPRED_003102 [Alectoria sarmentosa]